MSRTETARIQLNKWSLFKLEGDNRAAVIFCVAGSCWITQESDYEDHLLEAGEEFVVNRPGLALVQALTDAEIVIRKEARSCSSNHTLVKGKCPHGGPQQPPPEQPL